MALQIKTKRKAFNINKFCVFVADYDRFSAKDGLAKIASGRAKNAEDTIERVKGLPGLKGRLVRWLAGDVLPD